jgi:hypothetical protein
MNFIRLSLGCSAYPSQYLARSLLQTEEVCFLRSSRSDRLEPVIAVKSV